MLETLRRNATSPGYIIFVVLTAVVAVNVERPLGAPPVCAVTALSGAPNDAGIRPDGAVREVYWHPRVAPGLCPRNTARLSSRGPRRR